MSWVGSDCRDPGTPTKRIKNLLRDYNFSLVTRDPGIAMPGSRLTRLRLFYVIPCMVSPVNRDSKIGLQQIDIFRDETLKGVADSETK